MYQKHEKEEKLYWTLTSEVDVNRSFVFFAMRYILVFILLGYRHISKHSGRVLTAGGREVAAEDVYGGLAAAAVQQQEQQRVHEGVHEGDVESNLHTKHVTIIYNSTAMLQQY